MATLRATRSVVASANRPAVATRPVLPVRRPVVVRAHQQTDNANAPIKAVAVSTAVATLMHSGNALAASELYSQISASDNRIGILATLFLPVLGWVAFNIAGPLFNQLDVMGDKAADTTPDKRSVRVKRSVAGILGLGAAGLIASSPADASEIAQLAASDNRIGILATLFLPVLGWVAFNIAGPLFNQLDVMGDKAADTTPDKRSVRVKRGVAAGLGLGLAGMLASAPAEASEIAQLAASDNRIGILATLFLPVLGWVAFNIAGPLFNQLDVMGDKAADTTPDKRSVRVKRGVAAGLGLGMAGLLASAPAEASEIAQLAASDNRIGILATLFLPVLGWVAFNIAGPLFNQLDVMGDKAADTTPDKRSVRVKRGVAAGLGMGAATLLASAPAEASEIAQLAASDNRIGILATLFLPVLGWVAFNIAGPLFNQLDTMGDKAAETTPEKRSVRGGKRK